MYMDEKERERVDSKKFQSGPTERNEPEGILCTRLKKTDLERECV